MAAFWNVSGTRWVGQFSKIKAFVRLHAAGAMLGDMQGDLDFITAEFHAYKATRTNGTKRHTLDNWFGHAGNDWNGAWREQSWVDYLGAANASAATKQPSQAARPGAAKASHLGTRTTGARAAMERLQRQAAQNRGEVVEDEQPETEDVEYAEQ